MEIKLRDYQIDQLNFIEDRIDLTNALAIESPTGSGKTYVMLEYAKRWLENHPLSNVVITTGFNNLVFLMEKNAVKFGLNPKIIIGTKACNCPKCMEEEGIEPKVFTEDIKFRNCVKHKDLDISTNIWAKKVCPYTKEAYSKHFQETFNGVGNLIITNHSSFLIHQDCMRNVSLVIVDEAHTFSTFYESYIRLELDHDDLEKLDEAINAQKTPLNKIIRMNINNGVMLPQQQVDKICDFLVENENIDLSLKVREFFETKPSLKNYIEMTEDSFSIDKFYKQFEFQQNFKFLLFSATVDKFTRLMFNCKNSYFYREKKSFCDFSKSEFIAIPGEFNESFAKFVNYVDEKNFKQGLCLSTTMYDVRQALNMDGLNGFKMFDDIDEFYQYNGKKILVGSRRLFQGVDIQNLQFVCLNKIPFPNWNEKTQKMRDYLTDNGKNGIDFWKDFSVPKTENDMIQTTGRLWRSPESYGVISLFDERVVKHRYIIRHVMNDYRYGIDMKIMNEDGSVENFDVKKMDEIDARKDESKDQDLPYDE